jgi:hypothetical protein
MNRFGNDMFAGCTNLETVDWQGCQMYSADGRTAMMGSWMFSGCSKLHTFITWPRNAFKIGSGMMANSGFKIFDPPGDLITASDPQAFQSSKLETIVIGNSWKSIGSQTFYDCRYLTNITFLPGSRLTDVLSVAFGSCTRLTTIQFPTTITNLMASCFAASTLLTSITFEADEGKYRSDGIAVYQTGEVNGVFNKYHTFVACPAGVSEITLQPETRVIGTHAFYGCNKLLDVKMNDLVERIEKSAFFECAIIKYVRLTANVKFIGYRAFESCAKLKNILYCSNNNDVNFDEGDAFPSNPNIYLFYDFPGGNFSGHPIQPILDHHCNIPTQYFSDIQEAVDSRRSANAFDFGSGLWTVLLAE